MLRKEFVPVPSHLLGLAGVWVWGPGGVGVFGGLRGRGGAGGAPFLFPNFIE